MKITPQVYVRGSVDAAEAYCRAFGVQITFQIRKEDGTYAHCELSMGDRPFIALSEAPPDCEPVPAYPWRTMAFNVYEMGTEDAVRNAFQVLSEGGTVVTAVGPCDWSACCANVIDRFGVFWWIAI